MNFPMTFSDWSKAFLSTVSAHPVLERLFFASVEFAALAILVWFVIRVARIKSARLMSLLWLVALAKPIVSLALSSPLPLLKVEIAKPAEDRVDQVAADQPLLAACQVQGAPVAGSVSTVAVPSGRESADADFSLTQVTDDVVFPRALSPAEFGALPAAAPIEASAGAPATETAPTSVPANWNAARIAISLWLAGVVFFVFRSALDRLRLRRLIQRAMAADAALAARYVQLAAAFGVSHAPRLKVTEELESPALVGSLVPTVLIPRWLVSERDGDKIDWALRHELMHWKLFDTHAGLVREVAQALFYFHPAVWWAGRNWEAAAELACDRAIISDDDESRDYAAQLYGMLVEIRDRRRFPVTSGLFATRTQIRQRIAALVQGPCRTRAHLGAFALVAVTALSLAALSIGGTFADKGPSAEASIASDESAVTETPPASAKDPETVSIAGVVLKPDGSPAAGATVRAATAMWAMLEPIVGADFKSKMSETKADAQGRFSISFSKQPFGDLSQLGERWQDVWKRTEIAASLPGFGPAWIEYGEIDSQQPVTLKLVEDVPIHGRIVDLEGRPVTATTVKVGGPQASKDEDLSAWIEGIRAGELPWVVYRKASRSVEPRLAGTPTLVTTDRDGMFEIRGLGRERVADFTIEGETVAHRTASAVTRDMPPIRRTISGPPSEGTQPVFGAEFTFTAEPARLIEGVVRDAKSGEPLAGVSVESEKLIGYPFSNNRVLKTTTDKLGQFRLLGMPKGSGNRLLLVPNDEQPYFMREVDVPDPVGLGPAKMEIELHRGIWITGRVTDKATGKPIPGVRLHYLPFRSNEYAQRTPEFDSDGNVDGDQMRYVTSPDGTYRLVGLPGRAIVGAESVLQNYRRVVGYDAIDAPKYEKSDWLDTYRNPINPGPKWPSVMREINPAADAESVSLDFQLDPGQSLRIRVVDSGGQPASGVSVTGLSSDGNLKDSRESVLVASNFGPGETRIVLFHHEQRNLGRVVTIGPEQLKSAEITVELQPCATIVGRILNADGASVSGMGLRLDVQPGGDFFRYLPEVSTNAQGRFQVTLLPGCRYTLNGEGGGFQFVTFAREISIEPGETKDLGTLTIGKDGKVAPQSQRGDSDSATVNNGKNEPESDSDPHTIHGRVLGPDGRPAAKAHVAAIGMRRQAGRGGDLNSSFAVLGEAITDGDGRYRMQLTGVSSNTHSFAKLIARTNNAGLAWKRLDPDARDVEASFELPSEQVIRGRLIDIEGQPAANVRISVKSVVPTARSDRDANLGVGYDDFEKPPQAWPSMFTSDEAGKFAIHGIPADHGVYLGIEGTDRIARQGLSINTGLSESRPKNDATYRDLVRNFKPGEEVVLPVAPAQIFEGVVRYADTNEPAPFARLTIWASQQDPAGSMISVAGKADVQGRYRINPLPGVLFGVTAYPPDGVPYLARQIRDISRKDAALVKQVDVSLPRGALVRGRVVESGTKKPVAGAAIQYIPERFNNPNAKADIITGWLAIQLSGEDGSFEMPVLPGPGILIVNGQSPEFVSQELGARQLDRGLPGGERNYAHAFQRVNPEANGESLDVTIELKRGTSVSGRITTAAGNPVEHALLITRLNMHPMSLTWRGFPLDALGGRFELSGLADGAEYPIHFLDAKNRLGATLMASSAEPAPIVVLVPCGDAAATFIDNEGKPVADHQPQLEIVLTPGAARFDLEAMRRNAPTADAAFIVNVDRTNYRSFPKTDGNGRVIMPALIPGARYRINTFLKGRPVVSKEFVAESGKTLDLGKITIEVPKEE